MLNLIVLKGRLTKEVTLKKGNDGKTFGYFDLAVDNPRKEQDGTRGSSFFPVKIFGQTAETMAKFTTKGSAVAITGSIQQRNFLRADGTKGSTYEVYADSVEFLDSKPVGQPECMSDEEFNAMVGLDADEEVQVAEAVAQNPEPKAKFNPYTGKPLTQKAKKA